MRYLILSWDGGGNTPSAYHLGSRLVRRGHRVRMMGWGPMAVRAAAAGIEFTTYPTAPEWPADLVHEDHWDLLEDCLWGPACRADIRREAVDFGADVVIVDCMMRAGFDAVRDLRLPSVALVHVSYQQFVHVWGDQAMGTGVATMLEGTECVLALQPPGFDEPCPLPPGVTYVGAIAHPDATARLDAETAALLAAPGDPWVLVSLSTTTQHGQRAALGAILAGVSALPVRALLTLAGNVAPAELTLPPNVAARGFLPHEVVLPHVAAVVTHAGMGTVATTLAAGVPMVCMPLGRDQAPNADRVAAIGAGLVVAPDAAPAELADALRRVLAGPRFRSAAEGVAAQAAAVGQGELATDLVEEVAPRLATSTLSPP